MTEPILNTNLFNEGAENEEKEGGSSVFFAKIARRLLSVFFPPPAGDQPVRTTGPLAPQKKTHALLSPGFGEKGPPRHNEDAPSLAARASHVEFSLLTDLRASEAEGGGGGDKGAGIGSAGSFAVPTGFFSRNPVLLRLQTPSRWGCPKSRAPHRRVLPRAHSAQSQFSRGSLEKAWRGVWDSLAVS